MAIKVISRSIELKLVLKKNTTLKSYLEDFGYHQLIDKVTHDEGHTLDHIYVSNLNILSKENVCLKTLYFSDHDAICIRLENRASFI